MTLLRDIRDHLTAFYGKNAQLIRIIFRALLAFFAFMSLAKLIGGDTILTSIFVIVILSLICGIMPLIGTPILAGVYLAACAWLMGYDAGAVATITILVLFLLFIRFSPDTAILLILVPAALFAGIPQVIPVCTALKKKLTAILSMGCGVVVYYLIRGLHDYSVSFGGESSSDLTTRLQTLTGEIFGDIGMILTLIAMIAAFIAVYAIRRLSVKASWQTAVPVGAMLYVLITAAASVFGELETEVLTLVLGTVLSVLLGYLFVLVFYDLDYRSTEYLQFEDDDYYYYVKAVPKMTRKPGVSDGAVSADSIQEALENEITDD